MGDMPNAFPSAAEKHDTTGKMEAASLNTETHCNPIRPEKPDMKDKECFK